VTLSLSFLLLTVLFEVLALLVDGLVRSLGAGSVPLQMNTCLQVQHQGEDTFGSRRAMLSCDAVVRRVMQSCDAVVRYRCDIVAVVLPHSTIKASDNQSFRLFAIDSPR
jgi:hypothetical protein